MEFSLEAILNSAQGALNGFGPIGICRKETREFRGFVVRSLTTESSIVFQALKSNYSMKLACSQEILDEIMWCSDIVIVEVEGSTILRIVHPED